MSLRTRLIEDMKLAMKNQDKFRLSVIRMARAAVQMAEIEQKAELSDEQVLVVLNREIKQRNNSLQEFKNANRMDLVVKTEQEIAILMEYLPQQLTLEAVEAIVQEAVTETGATSKKDMGKLMQYVMPKIQGQADGKLVNQIAQQYLK